MSTEKNLAITDEQVTKIYKALENEDATSVDALEVASAETESTEYEELESIDLADDSVLAGVEPFEVADPTREDYLKVLSDYNITDEEASSLLAVFSDYKRNPEGDYFDRLPQSFKDIALGFKKLSENTPEKLGKNSAARMLLKELMHDAQFNNAAETLSAEFSNVVTEMNEGYSKIFTDAFDEVFERIDEIEAENPEQAAKIREIKKAFDAASTFDIQIEYLNTKISAKQLNKLVPRFNNERYYFNKKVNVTDVKVPDIGELLPIIHNNLPDVSIDNIKKFIIVICKSCYDLDPANNPADIAYIYRLINNIYTHKYVEVDNSSAKLLFGNIAEVINCIINK